MRRSGFLWFFEWNPERTAMDNRLILGVLLIPTFEIFSKYVKTHCFFCL